MPLEKHGQAGDLLRHGVVREADAMPPAGGPPPTPVGEPLTQPEPSVPKALEDVIRKAVEEQMGAVMPGIAKTMADAMGGFTQQALYEQMVASQEAMKSATPEGGGGGVEQFNYPPSSDMLAKERLVVMRRFMADPQGEWPKMFVRLANGGSSAQPEQIRLQGVFEFPHILGDMQRFSLQGFRAFGGALKAQSGMSSFEGLPEKVGDINMDLVTGFHDFKFPMLIGRTSVDKNGKREEVRELKLLGFNDAIDILERNSNELTSRLGSSDTKVRLKAEGEWAELIAKECLGLTKEEFERLNGDRLAYDKSARKLKRKGQKPDGPKPEDNLRFYSPVVPEGMEVADLASLSSEEINELDMEVLNPFIDLIPKNKILSEVEVPNGDGKREQKLLEETDQEYYARMMELSTNNWNSFLASLKWIEVGAVTFTSAFGRLRQYDPAILGAWLYQARKGLNAPAYWDFLYSVGHPMYRGCSGAKYYDFMSENATKLVPALLRTKDKQFLAEGLDSDSKTFTADRDLREQLIGHVIMDRPLRWWLEPFNDALMGKGERAVKIPAHLVVEGVPGRNSYVENQAIQSQSLSGWLAKLPGVGEAFKLLSMKRVSGVKAQYRVVDFSDFGQAMNFLLNNREKNGSMRTIEQMILVAKDIANYKPYQELFKGWDARPLLKDMGWGEDELTAQHYGALDLSARRGLLGRLVPKDPSIKDGVGGLDGISFGITKDYFASLTPSEQSELFLSVLSESEIVEYKKTNNPPSNWFGRIVKKDVSRHRFDIAILPDWVRGVVTRDYRDNHLIGVNGLVTVAEHHSFKTLKWENLTASDPGKWFYYLAAATKVAGVKWNALSALNVAGEPEFDSSRFVKPFSILEEWEGLAKAVSEAKEAFSAYAGNYNLYEDIQDFMVAALMMNATPGDGVEQRVFRVDIGAREKMPEETTDLTPANAGVEWRKEFVRGDAAVDNVRPGLGFFAYRRAKGNDSGEHVLVGPGGRVVAKTKYEKRKKTFSGEFSDGRRIDLISWSRIVGKMIDIKGAPKEAIERLNNFLLIAYNGQLPLWPVMSEAEARAERLSRSPLAK